MSKKTCAHQSHCAGCHAGGGLSRREFVGLSTAALGLTFMPRTADRALAALAKADEITPFKPCGPGATYVPRIKAAAYYIKRVPVDPKTDPRSGKLKRGVEGRFPVTTYDVDARYREYCRQLREAEKKLAIKIDIADPIHSVEDAKRWVAQIHEEKPDGLLVMKLDLTWRGAMAGIESVLLGVDDFPMVLYVRTISIFGRGGMGLHKEHTQPGRLLCMTQDF